MLSYLLATGNYEIKSGVMIALAVAIALIGLFIGIAVLIQPSNSNGISAINGASDTFYEKNKSKNLASKMKKLTVICMILIAVLMIAYFLIERFWVF